MDYFPPSHSCTTTLCNICQHWYVGRVHDCPGYYCAVCVNAPCLKICSCGIWHCTAHSGNGGNNGGGPSNPQPDPEPETSCMWCTRKISECECPIEEDCNDQATKNALQAYMAHDAFKKHGSLDSFIKTYHNNEYEFATTILQNKSGDYKAGKIETDSLKGQVHYFVAHEGSTHVTVAAIHNHPSGQCHSTSDAFSLARNYQDTGGKFTSSFVVATSGGVTNLFVLTVEDSGKIATFMENNKDIDKSEKERNAHLKSIQESERVYDTTEQYMYALAAWLAEKDSGIKILKLDESSSTFKQRDCEIKKDEDGNISYGKLSKCK